MIFEKLAMAPELIRRVLAWISEGSRHDLTAADRSEFYYRLSLRGDGHQDLIVGEIFNQGSPSILRLTGIGSRLARRLISALSVDLIDIYCCVDQIRVIRASRPYEFLTSELRDSYAASAKEGASIHYN